MNYTKVVYFAAAAVAFVPLTVSCRADEPDERRPPITLKIGEEIPVDFKGMRDATSILEPSERQEFLRDALLTAAFTSLPSSAEHRHDFLAAHGALRRPYLDPLAPGDVGRGRYAALSKVTGLLLVPFDMAGKSFDLTTAYRLLDKHFCLEGKLPIDIHVVAYRLDSTRVDLPKAGLTRLDTIRTKVFYTDGKHGYAEADIGKATDLGRFLEKIDDLLTVRVKDKKFVLAGRKYPEGTFKAKVRDRITLDDLKVLWAAFHDTKAAEAKVASKIKERYKDKKLSDELLTLLVKRQLAVVGDKGSELGFSLDPWIDLKKLQQLIAEELDDKDLREEILPTHLKRLEECKDRLDAILKSHSKEQDADNKAPVMEVPSAKADDRTGLFVFKDEVSRELEKSPNDGKLRIVAALLEAITHESQFIRARYEGVQPGTSVAMTMYYCDLIAKAYAFGQLEVKSLLGEPRVERIVGLPRVDGFASWPQIRLGGQYWDEVRKAKSLRLWWSADTSGFRWEKKDDQIQIVFAPQAVRISFRNKIGEIAEEQDPDALRALFRDRWNRYYLDIADQDCVFHHFNEIYKWAIAIKALKELGQPDVLEPVAGKPERTELRFDKWYQDAVQQKKVGFQVKFDFSKRYKGVPEETMGFVHSGEYSEAGKIQGWTGGGDLGPTKGDIDSAKRLVVPERVPETEALLPSGRKIIVPRRGQERVTVVPANIAKLEAPSVRLLMPRVRLEAELAVDTTGSTLRNWMNDGKDMVDASRLTIKAAGGRLVVELTSGTYDRAFSVTRAISAGREFDSNQVAEVRYSETGGRMLVRLKGEKDTKPVWVEVLPGGFGGGKEPPNGSMAVGLPGEPGWFYTIVRPEVKDDELARYRPSSGKGFIRVEITGSAFNPYRLGTDWFPNPPGRLSPASLFGKEVSSEEVKTSLLNASAEENRCTALLFGAIADPANSKRLVDVARMGLQKDAQDEAFDHFARMIGRGATPVEIRVGSGKERLTVTRQGDIYVVSRAAEADSLLPAESPFRYVVTEPETVAFRGVRVLDRTLILPEKATDGQRKTSREVVEFLSKNQDLVATATNFSDLNIEVLTRLKTGYDTLGNSAVLEWDGNAKTYAIKGGDVKFTRLQLIAWSNKPAEERATGQGLSTGVLAALKRQPLVIEELPTEDFHSDKTEFGKALRILQAEGVQVAFKLSETRADAMPARLKGLMAWRQFDFEAESVALDQVTNDQVKKFAIGYLRLKSRPSFLVPKSENDHLVRVIVDHAEAKLTFRELIDRANAGQYRNRHLVLGVCNDSPADIIAFCKAAYANGSRGVVIPTGKVSIPVVLMTAESLNANPLFRSGNIPQAAWKKAEANVLEKLRLAIKESGGDDSKAVEFLDGMIPGFKTSPLFLDERGTTKGTIDRIKQFIGDAERNTWNQTTSRPLDGAGKHRVAA